ncbi:MAG TPA: CPBP family intramembrane glutamic endopeptidase [Candidatus Saccharimonadales bacterium]|nr:CPBP family intramembrane glutamic endopeptidase [Candidatus Saccharimonadales bacterium]
MGKAKQDKKLDAKRSKLNAKTGYGPKSAILVTLSIYFGTQILAGILVGLVLYAIGKTPEEITNLANDSVFVGFGYILLVEAFSLWFLWWFLKYRKISFKEIGLKKPSVENILYALPAYAVYFVILFAAFTILKGLTSINTEQEQQVAFESVSGALPLVLVFISLVILPALVEEIMIRGFLYSGLVKKYSKRISAVIASVIFAIAHLQLGSGEPPLWIAAVDTFILSMVLIYLRELTGSIWAGVVVHIIKNSFAFIGLFILRIA